MAFFQDFPAPEVPSWPKAPKPVRPEWSGAPEDELPAVVHVGQFPHRSPTRILAVRGAEMVIVEPKTYDHESNVRLPQSNLKTRHELQIGPGSGPSSPLKLSPG